MVIRSRSWIIALLISSLMNICFAESPRVGVILPLTGNAASYGAQFQEGIGLAPSYNSFRFIYEDSRFDSKIALSAYRKLQSVDKIQFLISFGGATCKVLNEAAQRDKIVHIAAGCNTAPFRFTDSYNFRLDVNESIAAEKTAQYFGKNGVKTVAFIYVQNSWAETIIDHTEKAFKKNNLVVSHKITFSESGSLDLRSELIRLKEKLPDRIFLISLPELTPVILKQLRELQIETPITSNISIENPEVLRLSGSDANGITYLSVRPSLKSKEIHQTFYEKFPEGNPFAAWGYDSVELLEQAFLSDAPRKFLQGLDSFVGAFNVYNFDDMGELTLPYEIRIVGDGKFVKVE